MLTASSPPLTITSAVRSAVSAQDMARHIMSLSDDQLIIWIAHSSEWIIGDWLLAMAEHITDSPRDTQRWKRGGDDSAERRKREMAL